MTQESGRKRCALACLDGERGVGERGRREGAYVFPSLYRASPSSTGSSASFALHSPRLFRSLAAQTSAHESRIVTQTKLFTAGVFNTKLMRSK